MKRPFNLMQWVAEHREQLKPPVGNKQLYRDSDFIVMVVGGPNARNDFHYNETDELFYQLEGEITVHIQTNEGRDRVTIGPGEIFLLPGKIPHSPVRPEGTVGLVVELDRKPGKKDGLLWYCEQCNHKLYEEYFELQSIETDFLPVFKRFNQSKALRTCDRCGYVTEADERYSG